MARAFVREQLPDTDPDIVDRVTLCVSELVTNALDHAEPPFVLRIAERSSSLRVEVRDASDCRPVQRDISPTSVRGRGMFLVSLTSSKWGVDELPVGKTVWAEFAAT